MNVDRHALILIFLTLTIQYLPGACLAQQHLPTINATSKTITIIDGDDKLTGEITPELDPDIYVYHPASRPKMISIITDIDRVDVMIDPGASYDFAILLNGKQCNQRLSPINPNGIIYRSKQTGVTTDSVPITVEPNHAIHFQGSINKSQPLDLIFDTGASVGVLSDEGRKKGASIVTGPKNYIELDQMTIDNSEMVYIDYGGKLRADGVVGYNAFMGKAVHIDYDHKLLSVSDRLPELDPGYVKTDLVWRGTAAFVPITLQHGLNKVSTIALFDTGSKWSLSLAKDDPFSRENYSSVKELGWRTGVKSDGTRISSKVFNLDRLTIGGIALNNVQTEIEQPSQTPGLAFNILGNDFLRRFNVVIDYRTSVIYLQPNTFTNEPYNPVFNLKAALLVGGLGTCIVIAGCAFWWSRARRRSDTNSTIISSVQS